jgi:hypothetical protein
MNMKRAKLGPTGNFPRGKLHTDDKGELKISIREEDKTMVIYFGISIYWIGLDSSTAKELGTRLLDFAHRVDKENEDRN